MGVGDSRQQVDIEPFVDHAVEAETRMGQVGLVRGFRQAAARDGEVGLVHGGREGVDVGVGVFLRLPDAVAAGEDHIGDREEFARSRETSSGGANLKFESSSMQS